MIRTSEKSYRFHLRRTSYRRTSVLSWLLFGAFLSCIVLSVLFSIHLLPTYAHTFTLYLKWQDALVALSWGVALFALGGCILVLRFLYALRVGYTSGMLLLDDAGTLTMRDLSPKNLGSIAWAVSTALGCFVAALVGLVPEMLIGWTLHLPHPGLVVLGTALAILLGVGGLFITLPACSFVCIGLVGGISFCRKMGAPQTYQLTDQATLRIDGFVLAVVYPDKPESLFDLNLLTPDDQRQLLYLLRERWLDAEHPWNPRLGEEIEAALREAEQWVVYA